VTITLCHAFSLVLAIVGIKAITTKRYYAGGGGDFKDDDPTNLSGRPAVITGIVLVICAVIVFIYAPNCKALFTI
jgi:hypothetical protein